jgi:hypothetical protein
MRKRIPILAGCALALIVSGVQLLSFESFSQRKEMSKYRELIQQNRLGVSSLKAFSELAEIGDLVALREAKRAATSPHDSERKMAASALGLFVYDDALEPLLKLVDDAVQSVSLEAVRALGKMTGERREERLLYLFLNEKRNVRLQVEAASALMGITEDSFRKRRSIAFLKETLLEYGGRSEIRMLAADALFKAGEISQSEQALLRTEVQESVLSSVDSLLVSHLVKTWLSSGDGWAMERLNHWTMSAPLSVQKAVVETLHISCPANRKALLSEVLIHSLSSDLRASALSEVKFLDTHSALSLLTDVLNRGALKEEEREFAQEMLARFQVRSSRSDGARRLPYQDLCQSSLQQASL